MALDWVACRQLVIDVAIKPVEDLRRVNHNFLRPGVGEAVYERLEESHMLDVERAMGSEIGEAVFFARA